MSGPAHRGYYAGKKSMRLCIWHGLSSWALFTPLSSSDTGTPENCSGGGAPANGYTRQFPLIEGGASTRSSRAPAQGACMPQSLCAWSQHTAVTSRHTPTQVQQAMDVCGWQWVCAVGSRSRPSAARAPVVCRSSLWAKTLYLEWKQPHTELGIAPRSFEVGPCRPDGRGRRTRSLGRSARAGQCLLRFFHGPRTSCAVLVAKGGAALTVRGPL